MKRAMSPARLLGSGMDHADLTSLYAAVDAGEGWTSVAQQLGDDNAHRAQAASEAGQVVTARGWWLRAASCYRVAQVPLPDNGLKAALYESLIDAYGAAGALDDVPIEHLSIPYRGGRLCGWLSRPAEVAAPPTVIVFGGFDGWREEYHVAASELRARGLATMLVDLPGQGETRLAGELPMSAEPDDVVLALGAYISWALDHPLLGDRVGIWGSSMGGYLAARGAARDHRVAAVCVVGGTDQPAEVLERYPRFIIKVMELFGVEDPDVARNQLEAMVLDAQLLSDIACPLLVLHGTPDQIFLIERARRLYELAGSSDKTWAEWPDGDHCLYNHTAEKYALVGDWFVDRLVSGRPGRRGRPV